MIPDHSLYFTDREWSGIEITNLSVESYPLIVRAWGSKGSTKTALGKC
jgi:hypothetical protein